MADAPDKDRAEDVPAAIGHPNEARQAPTVVRGVDVYVNVI
jgi:hypothetical protein